jgi:hypothetical protein
MLMENEDFSGNEGGVLLDVYIRYRYFHQCLAQFFVLAYYAAVFVFCFYDVAVAIAAVEKIDAVIVLLLAAVEKEIAHRVAAGWPALMIDEKIYVRL